MVIGDIEEDKESFFESDDFAKWSFLAMGATHIGNLVNGVYEGRASSQGTPVESSLPYILGAGNCGSTGSFGAWLKYDNRLAGLTVGAVVGGVLAVAEYSAGFGVGYLGDKVVDKVF